MRPCLLPFFSAILIRPRPVRGVVPNDAGPLCKTTFTSDLYKSRDIYGNFLRLVRLTRPY